MKTVYDFNVKDADLNEVSLSEYQDKVLLVVNVASQCGLTPQYKGLQELYEKYNVSFKIFDKIDVNGPNADPFYDFLKNEQPGVLGTKNIKWNFSKFLVNKDGKVVKRYSPTTKPEDIESDIENLLS